MHQLSLISSKDVAKD